MNEFQWKLARTNFVPPIDLNELSVPLESEVTFDMEDPCYYQITNKRVHGMYDGVFEQYFGLVGRFDKTNHIKWNEQRMGILP